MTDMRFKGLDLNLLVALDALMDTRSVSRAAERMNLSQPAMSAALGRLRSYFGDEILVADGNRMYPTAYAESLLTDARACLQDLEAMLSKSATFDPTRSQRTFRITASDYIMAAVVAPLMARLAEDAPGLRIDALSPTEHSIRQLEAGEIDLLVTVEEHTSEDHPRELLFIEEHVVIGWNRNPIFKQPLTESSFYEAGHVAVALGAQRGLVFGDRQIELRGKARRIEITASSFTAIPWLVENTQRLAVMHGRLARAAAKRFALAIAPLPFEISPMRETMQYHRIRRSDPGLAWLRAQLKTTGHYFD